MSTTRLQFIRIAALALVAGPAAVRAALRDAPVLATPSSLDRVRLRFPPGSPPPFAGLPRPTRVVGLLQERVYVSTHWWAGPFTSLAHFTCQATDGTVDHFRSPYVDSIPTPCERLVGAHWVSIEGFTTRPCAPRVNGPVCCVSWREVTRS